MVNKSLFSSESSEWATPQPLFDELNARYNFTLDPCATKENAKCFRFFTKTNDGIIQSWGGERVFMNPPYGREIGMWVKKAFISASQEKALVVCLLPARTDTLWFHEYCKHGWVRLIKGRLKFGDSKHPAPFPSMIVLFDGLYL